MPKQSLLAMKVAFGIRAQYATIALLMTIFATQVAGVLIFSGNAKAFNNSNPYDMEIYYTSVQQVGATYNINLYGNVGAPTNRTVTIKLDGNVVGTTQSNGSNAWTYTITGITDPGTKTITAVADGETLHSASSSYIIAGLEQTYYQNTYRSWWGDGNANEVRRYRSSANAVIDDVHDKAYYILSEQGFSNLAIQDTNSNDYIAKLQFIDGTPRYFPTGLILGSSKNYVYVVSNADNGAPLGIVKVSTVSNQVVSKLALTSSEEPCYYSGSAADGYSGVALSLDESTFYIRRCDHIQMFSTTTGDYLGNLTSGHVESNNYGIGAGSLQLSPDGSTLYSFSSADKIVYSFNTSTNALNAATWVPPGACTYMRDIKLSPDGSLMYVICYNSYSYDTSYVYAFTTSNFTSIVNGDLSNVILSGRISNMVFNSTGTKLYAGSDEYANGTVKEIDTTTQDITASPSTDNHSDVFYNSARNQIILPMDGVNISAHPNGQIWDIGSNTVSLNTTDVPNNLPPSGMHIAANSEKKYITDAYHNLEISTTYQSSMFETVLVPVGNNPRGVVVDSNEAYAYVANMGDGTISKVDTASQAVVDTISVTGFPYALALSPDNSRLYVTHLHSSQISVIDTQNDTVLQTIGVGNTPAGVEVSPDGSRVYVANSGSDTVTVINTSNNAVAGTVGVGDRPFYLRVSPDGSRVYVANNGTSNNTSVSVIDANALTASSPWTDASFSALGVNNLEVNADGTKLYLTTQDGSNCQAYESTTSVVIIDALNGIDGQHPVQAIAGSCYVSQYSPPTPNYEYSAFGFGKALSLRQASYTTTVEIAAPTPFDITTNSLAAGTVDAYYSQTISTTRTASGYISSGSLPDGLSISSPSGSVRITGYPTTAGTYNFSVTATPLTGSGTATKNYTIVVSEPFAITTTSLPNGTVDSAYAEQIATNASGGGLYMYVLTGDLPDGLTMDSVGQISGTPTTEGSYPFTVQAIRFSPYAYDNQDYTIVVNQDHSFSITTTTLPDGQVGTAYSQQFSSTSPNNPVYSLLSGSVPGLTLHGNGTIDGTPTLAGTYSLSVQAVDSYYTATKDVEVTIGSAPIVPTLAITTTSLSDGVVGKQYSQLIETDSSSVVTFNLSSGALPDGLQLNASGIIAGTPTESGTYTFTVHADNGEATDDQTLSIKVVASLVAPPTVGPPTTVNPPADTNTPPSPPEPTIIKPISSPSKSSILGTSPAGTIDQQNALFALAKRIPEPVALGFPWLLLLLAFVLVAIQYYQVRSESMATKRMQTAVANQERLVEEQNNFVALSTHYLHTPLTVIEGEITLMVKAGTLTQAQATKLKATLSSLNNEAEAVLAQEEQHELNS